MTKDTQEKVFLVQVRRNAESEDWEQLGTTWNSRQVRELMRTNLMLGWAKYRWTYAGDS